MDGLHEIGMNVCKSILGQNPDEKMKNGGKILGYDNTILSCSGDASLEPVPK